MNEWQEQVNQNGIFSLEAEQTVLGAIILEPESIDAVSWLESRDFFSERHQLLYEYMRYLYENGKPMDLIHIAEELQKHNKVDAVGGIGYISNIASNAITAANIGHYAEIVRKYAVRRRGVALARKITELSEQNLSDDEYFSEIEKGADELRPKQSGQLLHVRQTRKEYFDEKSQEGDTFIETGFKNFDEWGGGYARKSLIIKAGRPGVGKTAEALQECMYMAGLNEGAGAIFSQEMGRGQVLDRMLSCASGINYTRIRRKWFMQNLVEVEKVNKAYDNIEK